MNRKDMIIVAVLINAGLLVTLFVSALKAQPTDKSSSAKFQNEKTIESRIASVPPKKKGDPIAQVLSQYSLKTAQKEKAVATLPPPNLTPIKREKAKTPFQTPLKKMVRIVTVEKGDVLDKIARANGVSVDEIMKFNKMTNTRLQIGQELKLPKKTKAKKASSPKQKYYTVKAGDNPWTIAKKNQMQVEELLNLNNMDEAKAKKLRPGDRLIIK